MGARLGDRLAPSRHLLVRSRLGRVPPRDQDGRGRAKKHRWIGWLQSSPFARGRWKPHLARLRRRPRWI
eukprot:2608792-Pyramimonas_sp.AAC.1